MAPKFPDLTKAPQYEPMLMLSKPGVQRDGTRLSQDQYSDPLWTRFYQDTPIKMGGYREQLRSLDGIARALDVQSYDGISYVHAGQQDVIQRYTININTGLTSGLTDRTPVGFDTSVLNNWQFSIMYDTAGDANLLFAHAVPNIEDISDTNIRPIYYGEVRDTAALLELTPTDPADIAEVSGGVVAIWPYLVRYGQDGFVGWSVPGEPLTTSGTGSGTARPSGTKIVRGMPLRGTSGPACLLWALDSLVRMQFVGGTDIFLFDSISTSSSILSSNGVIEHLGVYYWATVSGFAMFNGVMREIPNESNVQFFLDNLNWDYRQKVFAMKIPRWNEIWWCFPSMGSTECNHAIIYRIDKGTWYDTPLPAALRSAGVYEQIYHFPIMASPTVNPDTLGCSTWQHEFGVDEISGAVPVAKAIKAGISTNEKNLIVNPQGLGTNRNMSFNILEPDFNQVGDLFFSIESRMNARAPIVTAGPFIVPETVTNETELTKFEVMGRLNTFRVESNTLGGFFHWGHPLIHTVPGDGRMET